MSSGIKKGIKIFLLITVVTLILLLVFTVSEETMHSLKKMQPIYFVYAFIVLALYFYFDAVRIKMFGRALGHDIPISIGLDIIISGIFLAAVTPFQTGGLPVQLYVLKQRNISYGEGTLILFMRGVTGFFFYFAILPFIFIMYSNVFSSVIVRNLIKYLMVVYSVAIILGILSIVIPDKVARFIMKINNLLKRMKLLKSDKLEKFIAWFEYEIKMFMSGLKLFFKKRKLIIFLSFIVTFISFVFFFSIALIILMGLGVEIEHPLEVVNLQFLHAFLSFFMPTPGASGIAETLFATLFHNVCPKELLGIYAILWRFFTFYLGATIGGFLTLKIINRSGKTIEEIQKEEAIEGAEVQN